MKTGKLCFLWMVIFGAAMGTSTFAQEQISGPQAGTLGPGTYIVVGDIEVLHGTTLEIVPGTEFLHRGWYAWNIYGQLNAEGAEGDSIYFIRQNPTPENRWKGIRFQSGASDASTLDYCVIDNCNIPSGSPISLRGGGIHTNGVDITVTNTRISNCDAYWDGGGIYAQSADITVDRCLIVSNTAISSANGGGIYLYNCPEASILNSIIAYNADTGT